MGNASFHIEKLRCSVQILNNMEQVLKYFPDLPDVAVERFSKLMSLYTEWNGKINVISRKDIDMLYLHHVLHSLAIAKTGLLKSADTVMDVGCGGGFPVIPLAILMPHVKFTAVDSIGKKIKVVDAVVSSLGLENVRTINGRAESVDELFDWVVSRAVTALPQFVEWTWNKTKKGILYLKGGDLTAEIAATGLNVRQEDISQWFFEEYFQGKKVLYVEK